VIARLSDQAPRTHAAGHTEILDADYAGPDQRRAAEACATGLGIRFHGLFLETELGTRIARVEGRRGDASDADGAIARLQESYPLGELGWTRIDASGTPEQTLARAKQALA